MNVVGPIADQSICVKHCPGAASLLYRRTVVTLVKHAAVTGLWVVVTIPAMVWGAAEEELQGNYVFTIKSTSAVNKHTYGRYQ